MEEFPSNSYRTNAAASEPPEEKPVLRVVSEGSKVTRKKPSLGRRMKEAFLGGDTPSSILDHVLLKVLIPAFRDMVHDAGMESLERAIYGGRTTPNRHETRRSVFGGNVTPINYGRYSSSRPVETQPPAPKRLRTPAFEDVILESRIEAEKVLDVMTSRIQQYGFVPIRVLYELIGEPFHHVDEKSGWRDLSDAGVRRVSGGYLLMLPSPEPRG